MVSSLSEFRYWYGWKKAKADYDINRGGYDVIASSIGGMYSITGTEDQPVRPGVAITDICTALYTHGAIMAALIDVKNGENGRWIQSDLLATQLSVNTYAARGVILEKIMAENYLFWLIF